MSSGFLPHLSRLYPLPSPVITSSSSPGSAQLIWRVPLPTTLYIILTLSSPQSYTDIGRRRNLPSSFMLTNCPGAVISDTSPQSVIRYTSGAISTFSFISKRPVFIRLSSIQFRLRTRSSYICRKASFPQKVWIFRQTKTHPYSPHIRSANRTQ